MGITLSHGVIILKLSIVPPCLNPARIYVIGEHYRIIGLMVKIYVTSFDVNLNH